MSLRVEVQRCPAVPTAPNTAPIRLMSRSACSEIMIALLPPSSNKLFPKRAPTATATAFPMRVEPVAEMRGMRVSFVSSSPTSLSPMIRFETPSGISLALKTAAIICWQAMAVKGVFSEGFQIQTLPHTRAKAAFQLQTATGKLKAEMMPTMPSGCHCSYIL
ncbi:hypothetical protein D3C87_1400750 [compost metagenome]